MISIIKTLLERDLQRLKSEIAQYHDEETIWHIEENIANPAGNLCLHLTGNLNTYIGAALGNTGYIRNRDLEFSAKNIRRDELLKGIEDVMQVINKTLDKLTDDDLIKEFPMQVFENKTSTGYMLVHLATHLSYHLGQVNYHRRLLDSQCITRSNI